MLKPSLLLASLTFSTAALADDVAPSAAPARDPSVAITFSPIHLAVPMAELTTEIRLAPRIGVAIIGGAGMYREPTTNQRISLFEGGASFRYYVLGSFRSGLQVGGEALYVHAITDATDIEIKAAGLGLSPFAGYKWTHSSGFTFDGQIGASFMVARANAATGQMAERRGVGPLLNLNVGYSF